MNAECYPITLLPHLSRLFRDYTELRAAPANAPVRQFYSANPFLDSWHKGTNPRFQAERTELVSALEVQNANFGAGEVVYANLGKLRAGARVVVTGQQVGLFGGPLLTLLKAATAIRKAQLASEAGVPHVPVFWMATEDHDLDEVNQATLLGKSRVTKLRAVFADHRARPVGGLQLGPDIERVVAEAEELLSFAPITEVLRACYTPQDTLASAFGKLLCSIFQDFGLIVLDASSREFHRMGTPVLRYAIEHADALHEVLTRRNAELELAGYAPQVLVSDESSLLFLLDESGNRVPLRRRTRGSSGLWHAGGQAYTDHDLLSILESAPERLSPNALLRPVFQDSILPTSAYVGGPAEIAYFAQCQPLYQKILGETTPILPRLSATLVPRAVQTVMDTHELSLQDCMIGADELAQRLAARAMPIEGKQKIAAAGNALDAELNNVQHWMEVTDPNLGRSAAVAANKMRYQMNRLRRLAANWQLQKAAYLQRHADVLTCTLYPNNHVQERLLNGIQLLAASSVDLPAFLVANAHQDCPGHRVFGI